MVEAGGFDNIHHQPDGIVTGFRLHDILGAAPITIAIPGQFMQAIGVRGDGEIGGCVGRDGTGLSITNGESGLRFLIVADAGIGLYLSHQRSNRLLDSRVARSSDSSRKSTRL